jgi:polyhydroxyalkanoate synthesis regulator phasin
MLELVKKTLSFGLGAALLTGEKLRQVADDAVARGEMSKDEARGFIDDVTRRAEEDKENMQSWMRDQMRKMMQEVGVPDIERIETLEKRIEALEFRLDAAETAFYSHEEIT